MTASFPAHAFAAMAGAGDPIPAGDDYGEEDDEVPDWRDLPVGETPLPLHNAVLSASMAAYSSGPPPNNPVSLGMSTPLLSEVRISGRVSDKFAMGYLGGIGTSSQFQGTNSLLPVLPPSTNDDVPQRIAASRGIPTGEHLMTRWERPNNFNPGLGTDTWRDGQNVTWTLANRGLTDATTGLMAPITEPARGRPGQRDPLIPYDGDRQGLLGNAVPPIVMVPTTLHATGVAMSLAEMRAAAQAAAAASGRRRR